MEREKQRVGGANASSRPIDLDHLERYTLGDRALEREILELFCAQTASYLEQLRVAMSDKDWRDAAHALKGSARAVGAFRAARAAERAEVLQGQDEIIQGSVLASEVIAQIRAARVDEIEVSLRDAEAYIAFLLKRRSECKPT